MASDNSSKASKTSQPHSRRAFLGAVAATGVVACSDPKALDGKGDAKPPPTTPSTGTGSTSGSSPSTDTAGTDTGMATETADTGTPRPPNILYIYSDQHRAGYIAAEGNPVVVTPTLDGLAAEGVMFTNMFTNGPSCRPARASMMTGRYVHEHEVWDNLVIAPSSIENHVRDLRDAGYETAVIGKCHLHDDKAHTNLTQFILNDWGFEYVHELVGQNEQVWHETPYSDWLTANTPAGERDKYLRYNNYADNYHWFSRAPDTRPWNLTTAEHLDTYTGQVAEDWLRSRKDPRPFYLQVNFPGPHKPFDSTLEFRALYDVNDPLIDPGILESPVNAGRIVDTLLAWKEELFTEGESRKLRVTYLAKVTLIDTALAGVLQALRDIGEYENTWIIYSSDHGELLGDHALTGKIAFYEGAIRVPLIIRPPGGTAPWVAEGMVEQVDVTATLRDIANLANTTGLPGQSLLARIEGGPTGPDAQGGRDEVISQNLQGTMVRTREYKMVYDIGTSQVDELFDLSTDPNELVNLVGDPAYDAVIDDLTARMVSRGAPLAFDSGSTGDTGGP